MNNIWRLPGTLLCAALAGACIPTPPGVMPSPTATHAPLDYTSATAQVAARKAHEDTIVVSGRGSILMTHGQRTPRVYVLLHGFTDVPTQFETIGKQLFADGNNVYIPRLPHHGERVQPVRALGLVRGDELAAFGDSSVNIAQGLGDSVVVIGLSAGGVIAAWIAQNRADVARAVLIAPAIGAGRVSDDSELTIALLASKLPDVHRTNAPTDSTQPEYLQGISTHGLSEVLRLGHRIRDDAERRAPGVRDISFLISIRDHTVSEAASLDLAQRWFDRGATVTVYRFPDAARVPHNALEVSERGGNPDVAFPVVEALARGVAPPSAVELQDVPCKGLICAVRRWLR